jgi:hypothetical protein
MLLDLKWEEMWDHELGRKILVKKLDKMFLDSKWEEMWVREMELKRLVIELVLK